MSEDEERSSETRSKEDNEQSGKLEAVVDREGQVLKRKKSQKYIFTHGKGCIIKTLCFADDSYLSGNVSV
jgi:hypothetical protein